jgi:hypothetical protein
MKKKKKTQEFNLEEFIEKNKSEKKKYILSESKKIKVPKKLNKKLYDAYRRKEVINTFIKDYIFKTKNKTEDEIKKQEILDKINFFKDNYKKNVLPEKLSSAPKNLFQISGAKDFYKMQLVLRSLTTTLGNFWEELAALSHTAISTEIEFGIKIKGVDIICIHNENPTYIQMKTMEDTLTGSQSGRSEDELSIHKHRYFAAVFEAGSNWTFNSDIIDKIKGKEFWALINLDYDYILENVKSMIKDIEDEFKKLTKEEVLETTD